MLLLCSMLTDVEFHGAEWKKMYTAFWPYCEPEGYVLGGRFMFLKPRLYKESIYDFKIINFCCYLHNYTLFKITQWWVGVYSPQLSLDTKLHKNFQDKWMKFCEVSPNSKLYRCWKFQLSILTNKKVLFLMQFFFVQFCVQWKLWCATSRM